MFGGVGLYHGGHFFALIDDDTLYFKVDDQSRADYEARGRGPFRPFADKPSYTMAYYEVPADVLESPEDLARWAEKAIAIAAKAPTKAPKKPKKKSALSPSATKKKTK